MYQGHDVTKDLFHVACPPVTSPKQYSSIEQVYVTRFRLLTERYNVRNCRLSRRDGFDTLSRFHWRAPAPRRLVTAEKLSTYTAMRTRFTRIFTSLAISEVFSITENGF